MQHTVSWDAGNIPINLVNDNVEKGVRQIPARSRREAMDLALALASQEIHPTISNHEETGWTLDVEPEEYDKAIVTIERYRVENRHWRGWNWKHHLRSSDLWFHSGSLFWCAAIISLYYWNKVRYPQLEAMGLMDSIAVRAGQWWRLFTAVTLHADVSHLAANASTGFLLLGIAMATYGPGFGIAGAYLAGAGGNLAALWFYSEPHRSLGASGMVMGALGLVAVQTFVHWKQNAALRNKFVARSFGAALSILILLGFSPNSDIIAHVGGFGFGCVFGCLLLLIPKALRQNIVINQICVLVTVSWVIFTWWLSTK